MFQWHRYLGIVLEDFYSNSAVEVVLEKDLSKRQKFLDIVLLLGGELPWPQDICPDGLEPDAMRPHTLLSFKSHQDALNRDSVEHLIACTSDYRYQAQAEKRAEMDPDTAKKEPALIPNDQLRVMAVTARYPEALAEQLGENWKQSDKPGVYEMTWGTRVIDVIVCRRVEVIERNSLWLLFSGDPEKVAFGMRHFGLKQPDLSTILNDIHQTYQLEGLNMPYTVEDYKKEAFERQMERLKQLSVEEKFKIFPKEELLANLSPEERLADLSPEQIEAVLKAKQKQKGKPGSS